MSVPRDPYRKDPNAPKDFYARRVLPIDSFEYCVRTTWWFREMSRRSNGKVFFKNVGNSADDVCLHIPASYRGTCEKFVKKYGSFLCNQAINSTDLPVDICSHILEPLIFNTPTPASWGSGGCWHNSFSTVIYDIFQKDKHRFRKKHTLEELYQQTSKMQEMQVDQLKYPEDAFLELRKRYLSMKDSLASPTQDDNNTPLKPVHTPLWKMFGYMVLPHHWIEGTAPAPVQQPAETLDVAFDFTYQDFQKRGAEGLIQDAIEKGKMGRQKWLQEIKDKYPRDYYTREEARYMYNVLKALVSDRVSKKAVYEQTEFDPELAEKLEKKRQKEITLLQTQIEVLDETIKKRERQVRAEKGLVPMSAQELKNLKDLTEDIHFQSAEADIARFMQGTYDSEYPLNVNNEAYEDEPPGYLPVNQEYTKTLKKILDAKTQTLAILEKHSEEYKAKKIPIEPHRQSEWEGYVASKLIWEDLQKNPQDMEAVPPSEIENLQKNVKAAPNTPPPPFIFGIDLATLASDPNFKRNFPELVNVGHYQPPPNPTTTKK